MLSHEFYKLSRCWLDNPSLSPFSPKGGFSSGSLATLCSPAAAPATVVLFHPIVLFRVNPDGQVVGSIPILKDSQFQFSTQFVQYLGKENCNQNRQNKAFDDSPLPIFLIGTALFEPRLQPQSWTGFPAAASWMRC